MGKYSHPTLSSSLVGDKGPVGPPRGFPINMTVTHGHQKYHEDGDRLRTIMQFPPYWKARVVASSYVPASHSLYTSTPAITEPISMKASTQRAAGCYPHQLLLNLHSPAFKDDFTMAFYLQSNVQIAHAVLTSARQRDHRSQQERSNWPWVTLTPWGSIPPFFCT